MTHRLARIEDFEIIYDLYMDEKSNPYLTYDLMNKEEFKPIFESVLQTQTLFVVEDEAQLLGTYRLIPKAHRQKHTVYLGGFAIKPDMQGKGIGGSILSTIKNDCFERGQIRIELTVDVNNAAAIALYKKMGFIIEGLMRKSYKLSNTNEFYDEYLMAMIHG